MPTTYAIPDGRTVMAATTYTGNGSTQTINNSANGVSFAPDWVWIKKRSAAASSGLFDTVRGAGIALASNLTDAERNNGTGSGGDLIAFNSNGFNLGNNTTGSAADTNLSGGTYVAWQWNAGGSTVTNTNGSISAQVRANATAGFSIVTYTGTGANATVGHGLGVAPKMMIVKSRSLAGGNWTVYHQSIGPNTTVLLNSTLATQTPSAQWWQNINPTSSLFYIGTDGGVNNNTSTYVAYCFAAVAGYSAFGSYTGNGSTDGPFVYLGFRPRWVMIRNPAIVANWLIFDSSRDTYNQEVLFLFANTADAEQNSSASVALDFVSNGFKIRQTSGNINASGNSLIYAAFAENPFNISRAR